MLVYYEAADNMEAAIIREKHLKLDRVQRK
jgi:predicted GIY-YIG superfamily endonuclease